MKNTITSRSLFVLLFLGIMVGLMACSSGRASTHSYHKVSISKKAREQRSRYLIVIDAGHGGEDFGTKSLDKKNPLYEKHLALNLALATNAYLKQLGYSTYLTRKTDTFIPLEDRARVANKKKGDLFISIHFNSAPNRAANGAEIFYYVSKTGPTRTRYSNILAQKILSNMQRHAGVASRGVKKGNFLVIRDTWMAAVLVEAGFLTNQAEAKKIRNSRYFDDLAWGIAQGVEKYFYR